MAIIFSGGETVMEAIYFTVCKAWRDKFRKSEWMAAFMLGKYGLEEALNILVSSDHPADDLKIN